MKKTYVEMHLHTKETSTCGTVSAVESIPLYKEYGYDAVIITDHFNRDYFFDYYYNNQPWEEAVEIWFNGVYTAQKAGEEHGLKVLWGMEIRFDGNCNDYLVYGITKEDILQNPCMWEWGEEKFFRFIKEKGYFFAQAHPFRDRMIRCNPEYLCGVEVFNAHLHHNSRNDLAAEFCLENNLIPIAGSDFHHPNTLRGCGILFLGEINTINDVVDMLFSGKYRLVIPGNYKYTKRNK
ncbi:MAG: PHP domain-containing protein [Clostridia bacterium]|nr:PHP domain-containing protein [Clostridia bacterium]